MNYLIEYRNDQVVKYASANQSPVNFFTHLFFTNGNGIEFEDGNIVEYWTNGRTINIKDIYKYSISLNEVKNKYNESISKEKQLEYLFNQKSSIAKQIDSNCNESELWEELIIEVNEEIANIETITTKEINDSKYWLKQLKKKNQNPLRISDDYFDLIKLNSHSFPELLDVALALTSALIIHFKTCIPNQYIENDLKILIREKSRLEKIKESK